jgi:hypothetical protein
MPENVITDNQTPHLLMDSEDWKVAFKPYEGRPSDALTLGCKLGMLRAYLDAQTIKCRQAIKALDLALEILFPFTSFHDASFDVFIKYTQVGLTFEEEEMVKALGVKF